jgi:hypothetical protein
MSPQSSCFCYIQSRILYLSSPIFLFLVQVFTVRLARRPEMQTPFLSFLLVFVIYRVACIFIWRVFHFCWWVLVDLLYKNYQTDHKFTLNTSSPTSVVSRFLFPSFFLSLFLPLVHFTQFFLSHSSAYHCFFFKKFHNPFVYNAHIVLMFQLLG